CGMKPDMKLLEAITKACGPAIYRADAEKVAASDKSELETIKKNFLMKKLGLADTPKLDEGLSACFDTYGRSNRNKFRPVVYYLLTKHFRKSGVFAD
ncbi:MAG: DUF2853 family protein, partial [Pseudomonadota bacterium]